ncbi:MAG: hypothetical protein ABH827_02780 [bacterium]
MKINYSRYFLFVLALISGKTYGADPAEVQKIYKSIEEQLVEIRKEHPTTQQKIYTILDQVNRLSSLASSSGTRIQHLEKEIKTKESEFNIIQDELIKSKKSAQETEDKIKTLANNFEQEKKLAQQLAQEKKKTELLATQQKKDYAQEQAHKQEHANLLEKLGQNQIQESGPDFEQKNGKK